ncbi:hypothetical protein [Gordonia malaquae]|uniref:hypothetical protein n=1 Tax=Gordonia malaquae TaxID=410332 RepID=UPI0030FF1A04
MTGRLGEAGCIEEGSEPSTQGSVAGPGDLGIRAVLADFLLDLVEEVEDVTRCGADVIRDHPLCGRLDLDGHTSVLLAPQMPAIHKSGDSVLSVRCDLTEQTRARRLHTHCLELRKLALQTVFLGGTRSVALAWFCGWVVGIGQTALDLVHVTLPEDDVIADLGLEHRELDPVFGNASVEGVCTMVLKRVVL